VVCGLVCSMSSGFSKGLLFSARVFGLRFPFCVCVCVCVPGNGSQDHHPSKNSVQKTICCNSTSNAPDDGLMYPKHVELRIHQ